MKTSSLSLSTAGVFLCISAALHLFSILLAGFHFSPFFLMPFGVVYFVIAFTFLKGANYWTRFTFLFMIAGALGAYILAGWSLAVPSWWLMLIVFADLTVAFFLLLYIIRH